jgi:hypothetical protein
VLVVALGAAVLVGVRSWSRTRSGVTLALALSFPFGVVAVACLYRYDPWLARLLLVPAALSAPLLAPLFRYRRLALGLAVSASLWVGVLHLYHGRVQVADGDPFWRMSRNEQTALAGEERLIEGLDRLDTLLPGRGCVAVALRVNDPVSPIAGPGLERHLLFLPTSGDDAGLPAGAGVLVTTLRTHPALRALPAGWARESIDGYWHLAYAPSSAARSAPCPAGGGT